MLVEIFCEIDDFCKFFEKEANIKLLGSQANVGRKPGLSVSEIITISIHYHTSRMTSFKDYYNTMVRGFLRSAFTNPVSYNRFIELRQQVMIPLLLFVKTRALGDCDGISIIDSTTLELCHVLRASSHKLFKGIAQKGKTSTGWFYGFKLHLIINSQGEIISFYITPGNVSDNNPEVLDAMTDDIFGKMIADRGYIGRFKQMYEKGITLVHGIRKNMKNNLMDVFDKWLLTKRGIIETVFGILKEWLALESSKNRNQIAYFVQIISALAAYHFKAEKPCIFPNSSIAKLCVS